MSKLRTLIEAKVLSPHSYPAHFPDSIQYETIMGSYAYGVSQDMSDIDIYGFCIPPKEIIFPHLAGYINGFGDQAPSFNVWQQHHIMHEGREYDISMYNIVHYFELTRGCNPSMIDSLFTPLHAKTQVSSIAQMVIDNRHKFLHKRCWHTYRGYAHQQLAKLRSKKPDPGSKRAALVQKHGYDTKFAGHIVRLIDQVEQILIEGDLDLQRNKDKVMAVRNGEWTQRQVEDYLEQRQVALQSAHDNSSLPHGPDNTFLRNLLLNCLEHHYGNLSTVVARPEQDELALREIAAIIHKGGY